MIHRQSAVLLPFWLFIIFAAAAALGTGLRCWPLWLVLSLSALSSAVYFHLTRRFIPFNISLFLVFLTAIALWSAVRGYYRLNEFLYQKQECLLKVSSLPLEGSLRNSFRARIMAFDGRSVTGNVRVFDYTRSMRYRHSYRVSATLRAAVYNGSRFYNFSNFFHYGTFPSILHAK